MLKKYIFQEQRRISPFESYKGYLHKKTHSFDRCNSYMVNQCIYFYFAHCLLSIISDATELHHSKQKLKNVMSLHYVTHYNYKTHMILHLTIFIKLRRL